KQEKRRYGSISRGGVFFASWRTGLAISLRRAKPRTGATVRLLLSSRTYRRANFHLCLGSVEIHRELMTAAARWMMALKLWSVLSARMAILLNSLSLQKKFSMRCRHL